MKTAIKFTVEVFTSTYPEKSIDKKFTVYVRLIYVKHPSRGDKFNTVPMHDEQKL